MGEKPPLPVRKSSFQVLVVEDYEPWRRFISTTLQKQSELEIICEASDGLEAVKKAEELQPDLILLDVGLPSLNGIEAARQIRKLSPQSKILFVSLESSAEVRARGVYRKGWVKTTARIRQPDRNDDAARRVAPAAGHGMVLLPGRQAEIPVRGQVRRFQDGLATQEGGNRRSAPNGARRCVFAGHACAHPLARLHVVPLSQLAATDADEAAIEAVSDWHYWVAQGYRF